MRLDKKTHIMKILFFSPNSNVIEHSIPETILIKELIESGEHQITRIYCDSLLKDFCTAMNSFKLTINSSLEEKNKICEKCENSSRFLNRKLKIDSFPLSSFLSKERKKEINCYIDNLKINDFKSDYFLSERLKKMALYETILKYKLNSLNLDKLQFEHYKTKLKVSLYSYFSSIKIANDIDFESVVVYSPQYEINNFFIEGISAVKKSKIYFIEGSENVYMKHLGLRIWDWKKYKLVSPVKENWELLKNYELPFFSEKIVEKHIESLHYARSAHVYSSQKKSSFNFRDGFSPKNFKKTFLLSTSSNDESYAAYIIGAFPESKYKSKVFKNQFEWINHTINFFKKRKEFALIIRIHPREFKNKRDNVISPNYIKLKSLFENNKNENIYINYPDENISIYNLFQVVDVTLVSWSLTAIESLIYNTPVIVYDNSLTNYPNELVLTGKTIKDYDNNLIKQLHERKSEIYRLKSFRWLQVNHFLNNVYLNNRVFFNLLILLNKILLRLRIYKLLKYSIGFSVQFLKFNSFSKKRIKKLFDLKLNSLIDTL